MEYRSIKGFTGWAQLGILLAFVGAGLVLAGLAQAAIYTMGMHIPFSDMENGLLKAMAKSENANWARAGQAVGTFFLLCVPSIFYLRLCHGKNKFWLGFNRYLNSIQVLIGFLLILLANIMAKPLELFTKEILSQWPAINAKAIAAESAYAAQVSVISHLTGGGELLIALVIMAFLPALFEELFFRGVLQNLFTRWWNRPLPAIIAVSLIFSLIHSSYYLFLSRALLGFVLGWMFYQSRNIWVNTIAHFMNNAIVLLVLYFTPKVNGKIDLEKADPQFPLWASLAAVAATAALAYVFSKRSARNRTAIALQEQVLLAGAKPMFNQPAHIPDNIT